MGRVRPLVGLPVRGDGSRVVATVKIKVEERLELEVQFLGALGEGTEDGALLQAGRRGLHGHQGAEEPDNGVRKGVHGGSLVVVVVAAAVLQVVINDEQRDENEG